VELICRGTSGFSFGGYRQLHCRRVTTTITAVVELGLRDVSVLRLKVQYSAGFTLFNSPVITSFTPDSAAQVLPLL